MSDHREPLPAVLVGMVFAKLGLVYGKRFLGTFAADEAAVRAHWAQELAGLSPESITYALERLPADYVPNVLQLRMLATQRPAVTTLALPAPKVLPERLEQHLEAARGLLGTMLKESGPHDPIAWAVRINNNPQGNSLFARKMAREVLVKHGRIS